MTIVHYLQEFKKPDPDSKWYFAWFRDKEDEVAIALYPYSATHESTLYRYPKAGRDFEDIRLQFIDDVKLVECSELYTVDHELLSPHESKR